MSGKKLQKTNNTLIYLDVISATETLQKPQSKLEVINTTILIKNFPQVRAHPKSTATKSCSNKSEAQLYLKWIVLSSG